MAIEIMELAQEYPWDPSDGLKCRDITARLGGGNPRDCLIHRGHKVRALLAQLRFIPRIDQGIYEVSGVNNRYWLRVLPDYHNIVPVFLQHDKHYGLKYSTAYDDLWYYIGHHRVPMDGYTEDPDHPLLKSCKGLSKRTPEDEKTLVVVPLELVFKNKPGYLANPITTGMSHSPSGW
jgi:hypothetical protein